jgi:hypothetical protein
MYVPTQNKYAIPQRYISGNVSGSAFYNLIRQSLPTASGGNDTYASSDSTLTPSANGRYISASRWSNPKLTSTDFTSSPNQLPNWVYVDRKTGPIVPPLNSTTAPGAVARFAYNVYDIGGLLDANAAGFPSTETVMALKGTEAGANLVDLGATTNSIDLLRNTFAAGGTGGVYKNRMDSMNSVGWRTSVATNTADSTGATSFTNNIFASRQDLLRYAQAENTGLAPALPYLTTFSRSLSAPEWGPTTNVGSGSYTYNTIRETATATNRFIPDVRYLNAFSTGKNATAATVLFTHWNDDGTTVANSQVKIGDPIIQRKFSLAKLNWLSYNGINSAAFNPSLTSAQQIAAVQACFGLVWNKSHPVNGMNGSAGVTPAWEYVGSDTLGATALATTIASLHGAAVSKREPNFFELLKAGILSGSLGASAFTGDGTTTDAGHGVSQADGYKDAINTDFQTIRIGANIIDQWDTDSYPTAIAFGSGISGLSYTFYGIEDLPYINAVYPFWYWPNRAVPSGPVDFYLLYELWNPHTNSIVASTPPSQYPVNFMASINTNTACYNITCITNETLSPATTNIVYQFGMIGTATTPVAGNILENPSLYFTNTPLPGTDPMTSYREPHLIRTGYVPGGSPPNVTNANVPAILPVNSVTAPKFCSSSSCVRSPNYYPWTNSTGNNVMHFNPYKMVISLSYANPDSTTSSYAPWLPYTTYLGHAEDSSGGLGGSATSLNIAMSCSALGVPPGGLVKPDPRSYRFDASCWGYRPDTSMRTNDTWVTAYCPQWYYYAIPYVATNSGITNFVPATLAANAYVTPSSSATNSFTRDPDGAVRAGDYVYGYGNPYNIDTTVPATKPIDSHPVILNRPFQSVAEMGYAYRDMPFKTLDFFTSGSADSGLLNLFALHDEPLVTAGKVNINTAQTPVLQALFDGNSGSSTAALVATNFFTYTHDPSGNPTNAIVNLGQLAQLVNSYTPGGTVDTKFNLEAPMRDISSAVQSRTWNLLIDVVAQVGEFPTGQGTAAGNFVVQGEKRYWLSVAIDRYTGQVIDEQLESVNE